MAISFLPLYAFTFQHSFLQISGTINTHLPYYHPAHVLSLLSARQTQAHIPLLQTISSWQPNQAFTLSPIHHLLLISGLCFIMSRYPAPNSSLQALILFVFILIRLIRLFTALFGHVLHPISSYSRVPSPSPVVFSSISIMFHYSSYLSYYDSLSLPLFLLNPSLSLAPYPTSEL